MTTTQRTRVAFAGTPAFAVPGLDALLSSDIDIAAVYTQPDRRSGRGQKTRFCEVKQRALEAGLEIRQPLNMRDEAARLRADNLDLMVVIAFGQLLPQDVLDAPRFGCINVHASLLPRWRGAAPIARAIAAGDSQTGVCLMRMTLGLDEGPVIAQETIDINNEHTAASLHDALSVIGGQLLKRHIAPLLRGELPGEEQDDSRSTYARKLTKAEATIDWQRTAIEIDRQVRGFNPFPVATTTLNTTTLKIWQLQIEADDSVEAPGTVLDSPRGEIRVATGSRNVSILELQRPGGRRQGAADFLNGFALDPGSQLGTV